MIGKNSYTKKKEFESIVLRCFDISRTEHGEYQVGIHIFPVQTAKESQSQKGFYNAFQGFRQAKSANGGSILSSSQFLLLPQLPQKMKLASKVVKVNSKIIISLPKI